ncbi:hypothetical protein EVAR_2589_1 [Eumeta japonica]|uniref:Uncharacterized protein n=1 Tax=Eumeta variegata TaxID=151549 RepID=A0A4C1SPL1_EUMVA|nr:hypothetical protein EVAR_2589_1 [Eumeta japonica]
MVPGLTLTAATRHVTRSVRGAGFVVGRGRCYNAITVTTASTPLWVIVEILMFKALGLSTVLNIITHSELPYGAWITNVVGDKRNRVNLGLRFGMIE